MGESTAFGGPGIPPTWSSSDKDFVTTALGNARLWVTVGHGIINEIYWPSTGRPQIRDLGFYLLGSGRWIDLKRVRRYRLSKPKPYIPLLTIEHTGSDYRVTVEVLPDPSRDVVLLRFDVEGPYRLGVILAPHIGSTGYDNNAWIEDGEAYAGATLGALCLTADVPLLDLSAGYVGASDGWQDLARNNRFTYGFSHADHGNVALSASLGSPRGVIAVGFAPHAKGASTLARSSLAGGYDTIRENFIGPWEAWGSRLALPPGDSALAEEASMSATILKTHEDRMYPGAIVASMSTPWGQRTNTLGGYHLVWPRDCVQAAFALLAVNEPDDVHAILAHLIAVQQPDGHWSQNYFPSGEAFWTGIQLDETGFPVLLAAKLRELGHAEPPGVGAMVRAAIGSLARSGPSSEQDRWEENPGISAFTLAIVIAALVAAAPWLDGEEQAYALDLADDWNERIEQWCYVVGTPLAERLGVSGYYVRIAPPEMDGGLSGNVILRNRNGQTIEASCLVALDFSWLVRLGLRQAGDQRVKDTIRVVDEILRVETPSGAVYRRYNEDGYGEYDDGRPYDGDGVGRAWPLLAGERGHLALMAGEDPLEFLHTMHRCASPGGLLPEQVWDADPIPALGLFPGRPSGSAMPLVWSHAEFLKLLVACDRGRPVEHLDAVSQRYGKTPPRSKRTRWRTETPVSSLERGRVLVIEDREPFVLHCGWDDWQDIQDLPAEPLPFGLWGVTIASERQAGRSVLNFIRRYGDRWEQGDHAVAIVDAPRTVTLVHAEKSP
jgi:glucoamylase